MKVLEEYTDVYKGIIYDPNANKKNKFSNT